MSYLTIQNSTSNSFLTCFLDVDPFLYSFRRHENTQWIFSFEGQRREMMGSSQFTIKEQNLKWFKNEENTLKSQEVRRTSKHIQNHMWYCRTSICSQKKQSYIGKWYLKTKVLNWFIMMQYRQDLK